MLTILPQRLRLRHDGDELGGGGGRCVVVVLLVARSAEDALVGQEYLARPSAWRVLFSLAVSTMQMDGDLPDNYADADPLFIQRPCLPHQRPPHRRCGFHEHQHFRRIRIIDCSRS